MGTAVKNEIYEHQIERQMTRFLEVKYNGMIKVPRPEKKTETPLKLSQIEEQPKSQRKLFYF